MTKNCHWVGPALRAGRCLKLSTGILSAYVGSCRDNSRHEPTPAHGPEIVPYISPMSQCSDYRNGRDVAPPTSAFISFASFAFFEAHRGPGFIAGILRFPIGATKAHGLQRPVTEEQQRGVAKGLQVKPSNFIFARACMHLHAIACNGVHSNLTLQKHVRHFTVRTALCADLKNMSSKSKIERRLGRRTLKGRIYASLVFASSQALLATQIAKPFTGTLLLANLASEFISQPGHTGIMDTTSMCQAASPGLDRDPDLTLAPWSRDVTANPSREMGLKWEQNAPFFGVHFCKPWISKGLQTLRYNVVPFSTLRCSSSWHGYLVRTFTSSLPISGGASSASPAQCRAGSTLLPSLPHLYQFFGLRRFPLPRAAETEVSRAQQSAKTRPG